MERPSTVVAQVVYVKTHKQDIRTRETGTSKADVVYMYVPSRIEISDRNRFLSAYTQRGH